MIDHHVMYKVIWGKILRKYNITIGKDGNKLTEMLCFSRSVPNK